MPQIELAQNQLSGRAPDLQLPFLRELSLHSNNLSGPLPSLSKLPSLQTASLYNNQLTGEAVPALTPEYGMPRSCMQSTSCSCCGGALAHPLHTCHPRTACRRPAAGCLG